MGSDAELAKQRYELHKKHKTHRPLSSDYEVVGIAGERAFERRYPDFRMDETLRASGDGGKDFTAKFGTIDVKTAKVLSCLLCEVGKKHADVVVLAWWNAAAKAATLVGWAYSWEIEQMPVKRFHKDGPVNYFMHVSQLHPIAALDVLMSRYGYRVNKEIQQQ